MKPLLIAHRGDTNNYPENTIEAFKSAFEKGADGIELDVQFLKGELIIVHNYLFDKSKTYPLLSEVLQLFSDKGRIEIEIKSLDLDFIIPLKNILKNLNTTNFEITTSVYPLVSYLQKEFPTISLGIIFSEKEFEPWMTNEFICLKVIKMMQLFKANVAHLPWKVINKNIVNKYHTNEMKIHSHIYKQSLKNQISIYHQMIKLNIDQITFDDISLLKNLKR